MLRYHGLMLLTWINAAKITWINAAKITWINDANMD